MEHLKKFNEDIENSSKYNSYVIDFGEFTKTFSDAVDNYFKDERVNGYQRIYIDNSITDPTDDYKIIRNELVGKGYTEDDTILVDNSW